VPTVAKRLTDAPWREVCVEEETQPARLPARR
jgi:hypothetical protein